MYSYNNARKIASKETKINAYPKSAKRAPYPPKDWIINFNFWFVKLTMSFNSIRLSRFWWIRSLFGFMYWSKFSMSHFNSARFW
jgi:hypothetical protein